MPFTLTAKTALVTGAGRGIGRAIARALAEYGASVMINDLDAGPATETEALISAAGGVAASFPGDITEAAFPQRLVEAVLNRFGSLDIVVNNAGYTWDNVIQKMTDEQFQTMLDVHLVAPFRILRAASAWIRPAAKREIEEGKRVMRKVVNITSVAGIDGGAGQAAYASAKAGVIGLTKTLAKEWGRYNVNVNAVGFGIIETRLVRPILPEGPPVVEVHGRGIPVGAQPKTLEWAKSACPLGRLGTPEEAAGAVLFFCSPLSDYVTGETLLCGGGLHF
jgi:3-oxoacyl-[acyl-carrier protein] reductase